jgi:hypothetical protein
MKPSLLLVPLSVFFIGSASLHAAEKPATCYLDLREQMFADDGMMDVRLVTGFLDVTGTIKSNKDLGGREELETYEGTLKKLGFTRVTSKKVLAEMKISNGQGVVYEKRDSKGRPMRVSLMSSTDEDKKYNVFESRNAEAFFESALKEADVVIYFGHSRDGGGPDMRKPITTKDGDGNLHVDYAHYKKEKPGLKRIEEHLGKTKDKPELIASLSCSSYDHFYNFLKDKLQCADQSTGLILSTRTAYHYEGVEMADALLKSLARGSDLNEELRSKKVLACASIFDDAKPVPFRYDQVNPTAGKAAPKKQH